MPLLKSASDKAIGPNITREESAGKPYRQALAIALHTQDEAKRHHRAMGGSGLSLSTPLYERIAARNLDQDAFHPSGLFHSDVAGRTDRLPRSVAADSFVVPADVVSGLGQGNTLAGAKIMDAIVGGGTGPYGTRITHPGGFHRAAGGAAHDGKSGLSKVMVAGGEFLVNRDRVAAIGRRMRAAGKSRARTDLAAGHEALRELVSRVRKHTMKFLRETPPPKK